MGLLTSPKSARRQVSGLMVRGFAYAPPYTLTPGQPSPGRATLLRHPFGLPTTGLGRALGQLDACRPRLRSRLTLGGLACPRNPWSFGGGVSHPSFATHACILTRVASTAGSLRCFSRHPTLPYPSAHLDPKGASGHSRDSRGRNRSGQDRHPP